MHINSLHASVNSIYSQIVSTRCKNSDQVYKINDSRRFLFPRPLSGNVQRTQTSTTQNIIKVILKKIEKSRKYLFLQSYFDRILAKLKKKFFLVRRQFINIYIETFRFLHSHIISLKSTRVQKHVMLIQ